MEREKPSSKSPKSTAKSVVSLDYFLDSCSKNTPRRPNTFPADVSAWLCPCWRCVNRSWFTSSRLWGIYTYTFAQGADVSRWCSFSQLCLPHHSTWKLPSLILPSFPRMGLKDRMAGISRFMQLWRWFWCSGPVLPSLAMAQQRSPKQLSLCNSRESGTVTNFISIWYAFCGVEADWIICHSCFPGSYSQKLSQSP